MGKKRRPSSSQKEAAHQPYGGLTQSQADDLTALTWQLGEPLCIAEGMELVHVECRSESRGRVLRLYIDKPGGVMLSDCENISRQIGDLLDVHVDSEAAYLLEVSSPGPNRPVSKPSDFKRFAGHAVRIRTLVAIDNQQNFKGNLTGLKDDLVTLRMDDKAVSILLSQIKDVRLIEYRGEN